MKNYRKKESPHIPVCVTVSDKTGLPIDTLAGFPQITLRYGRELTVEGCCRISEYTSETLVILCKSVKITVSGKNIRVKLMDELYLVASGSISNISFVE